MKNPNPHVRSLVVMLQNEIKKTVLPRQQQLNHHGTAVLFSNIMERDIDRIFFHVIMPYMSYKHKTV